MPDNKLKNALNEYVKTKDEELKNKIITYIQKTDIKELREVIFDALVPNSGKADTIAGEMIRAVNRIGYRYFNDGDVYFAGYGLETAGSSAIYLSKISKALETLLVRLYPENYLVSASAEKSYKNFITTLETRIIKMIQSSPELILKRNTVNSATDYKVEAENVFSSYDEIMNDDSKDEGGDLYGY